MTNRAQIFTGLFCYDYDGIHQVRTLVEKVDYIKIHTYMPRNCTVFLLRHDDTQSDILWSQNYDSTKWRAVLIHDVTNGCKRFYHYYYYYNLFGIKTHTKYRHIQNKTKARDICL